MPPSRRLRLRSAPLVAGAAAALAATASLAASGPVTFATIVTGLENARHAEALIASVRRFAGPYRNAPIYVVVDDADHVPTGDLRGLGVHLLPLEIDPAARQLPLAAKAYAAAQVERALAGRPGTLAWLDPETVVLAPPRLLDLDGRATVALRPVHLVNAVGQPPEAPVDAYWRGVYRAGGADPEAVPPVETAVDGKQVRFYVNCQVIAWRLGRDIGPRWAAALSTLARDHAFLAAHAADPLHRLFLHQAALSAVLLASTTAAERRWLPLDHGYPLALHQRLPEARRIARLDGVPCVILDTVWRQRRPTPPLPASPALQAWFAAAWRRTFEVTPEILREEGACNTYVLRTPAGDVVVDPGGAHDPDAPLRRLHGARSLLAVVLTHGHPDHRSGIVAWTGGREVPVIAQRRHAELLAEQDAIAPLLGRRSAAVTGETGPTPPSQLPTPVEATVLFDQRYDFAPGGVRVELIHAPSETPDTAVVWVPSLRAAFVADMFYSSFPNLSTPRGGPTRSALEYIRALDTVIALEPELLLPGHEEPLFGRETVHRRLTSYRDAIAWVHDAVMRGIRDGTDVHTLMRDTALPERLALPEAFGRVSWSVRGIYEAQAGWFDGDVENLYPLPEAAATAELAALAGGPAVAERARALVAGGDPVLALRLTRAGLTADPADATLVEVRVAALRALLTSSRNYFERGFLRSAIRETEKVRTHGAAPGTGAGDR